MELKDFQQTVLDKLDLYLDELRTQLTKAEKIRKHNEQQADPELRLPAPMFSSLAWNQPKIQSVLPTYRSGRQYSTRTDGMANDVPNICLKIPTGGGKTLLAAYAVSRIMGKLLQRNYGFVLWITPNEAIYSQTRKQLTNREHPYRQILDRAAAGRVKILEKNHPLNKLDAESHLCVMLLMLQSAARESKETLRIFRDRGNVHGFFPAADDVLAHFELLGRIPNLDCYGNRNTIGATAYESLGNVLRVLRPVIVMDEGHRSYTSIAMNTIFGFNPQFVLELSATPKDREKDTPPRHANWLVNIGGADLQREEMIKLPINVKVKAGSDWKDCLRESYEHLNMLQSHADTLRANTSRYVRPILLVQVERVGKDQREKNMIHAEDAREFLLGIGVDSAQIAVKTSETNELKDSEGRDIDLLSPTCPVRIIITKQALQEGWDCPFAYVLCALAASKNQNAMTQLIGRILRQPDTIFTRDPILDECYVFCQHVKTKDVIEAIKKGLEQDGMADLADQVRETKTANGSKEQTRKLQRREKFRALDIYLPLVNWVGKGEEPRILDYDRDVLSQLDWNQLNVGELAEKLAGEVNSERSQMIRVSLADGADRVGFIKATEVAAISEPVAFDAVYATRSVVDIVPNPWLARAIIGDLLAALRKRGFSEEKLGEAASYILEELRKWLQLQRDRIAEEQFVAHVRAERIQFRLRADAKLWHLPKEMPTDRPANARQMARDDGKLTQTSLFEPVYEDDFNRDERDFACYLDAEKALTWWHRNVAKGSNYSIQGWKKGKVYPDFIFAHSRQGKKDQGKKDRILVWEMKGPQLEGNLDTEYKRKLLETVSSAFRSEHTVKAGTLELIDAGGDSVLCELVLLPNWKTKLATTLSE